MNPMKKQDGYVIDTTYPIFFYKEMQPLWLNTIVNFLGFKAPDIEASFSYLELGCATGTNLLVSAINYSNGFFVGVDFNQAHIDKAKASAQLLGLKNIEFICCDFSTFLEKNNRSFDFIVNHGTFSWISANHQKHILDIVSQSLNNTGIFYLHYMCYPGSSDLLPVQKLLNLVDQHTQESSLKSIDIGKKLFFDLNEAGAFINNPKIDPIIRSLENSHSYLAHEFLTDYWKPLYSVDLHNMVYQTTKISYLGSAHPCENIDSISIPLKMQNIIKNIQVPALKEYLKDLARDAKQRTDIFQKNPQVLNTAEHRETINKKSFKLLPNIPEKGILYFQTPIGNIKAPQEVISNLIESLLNKQMRFDELLSLSAFKNNPLFLIETIFLMMNAQYLHPVSVRTEHIDKDLIKKFNEKMKQEGAQLRIIKDCVTAI